MIKSARIIRNSNWQVMVILVENQELRAMNIREDEAVRGRGGLVLLISTKVLNQN